MTKCCADCAHFSAEDLACDAPQNQSRDIITGERETRASVYYHRRLGILSAWLEGMCGKRGRWFKSSISDEKATKED